MAGRAGAVGPLGLAVPGVRVKGVLAARRVGGVRSCEAGVAGVRPRVEAGREVGKLEAGGGDVSSGPASRK